MRIEVWLVITEAPRYLVSSLGRVKNRDTRRILKPSMNDDGYLNVVLTTDRGYTITRKVHRLVAEAFYLRDVNHLQVNHIDGMKDNNFVGNLEWVTQSENQLHAYRNGLNTPSGGLPKRSLRIIETGEVFESQHACARAIGGYQSAIANCLNGRGIRHRGYTFEYV